MRLIIDELAYILRTTNFDYHNPYYPNHDLQYESGTNIESFRYFKFKITIYVLKIDLIV